MHLWLEVDANRSSGANCSEDYSPRGQAPCKSADRSRVHPLASTVCDIRFLP